MSGRAPLAAVLVVAAGVLLWALWIPLKSVLAQALLEQAWSRTLQGATDARPWPWADTVPAGILEVPRRGVRQVILAGASGRNLAFGPSALTAIDARDLVLSGHRDTHFGFLGELEQGELIRLTTVTGQRLFRVSAFEVIDSRVADLVLDPDADRLTLLTCYPLDAPMAGGPLRLLVTAQAESEVESGHVLQRSSHGAD